MGLQQWLDKFCGWHEQARAGTLPKDDQARYLSGRDELARALLKAQQIILQPGELPRRSLRASTGLQITVEIPGSPPLQTITRDIGSGGFSIRVSHSLTLGMVVPFTLKLTAKDPVEGKAKLVSLGPVSESRRASFAFEGLKSDVTERIEMTVFDAIVAQLKPGGS
jgi:hypothetical protein